MYIHKIGKYGNVIQISTNWKLLTGDGKIYRYGQFSTSFNDVKLNEYFVNNCENHFTDFIINQPFDDFIKPYMNEHLSQIKGLF